jgi:hypothetical protein
MKRFGFIGIGAMLAIVILMPARLNALEDGWADQVKKSEPTRVYYFHMERRCMTCQTVEKVAEQSVKELYPEAFKNGNLTFKAVNIEEKENKALVRQLKVGGQALLITNGQERFDITDKGFLYAVNEPDKLKAEMKSILEKFVK